MILLKEKFKMAFKGEEAVGVIEVVLILVVLIALVLIFKTKITDLLENIFDEIENQAGKIY